MPTSRRTFLRNSAAGVGVASRALEAAFASPSGQHFRNGWLFSRALKSELLLW
jgi:hypothetical protein